MTPAGEAYTYSANDMSVGDVDGDGQYEYVVKWDPSNSKDVSQVGYTGPVYIDTYELDGTLLYRIDLGVNVRAGAHYTQFLVYDFDGDGRSEMMFKTAPGTKIIRYDRDGTVASERFITMPRRGRAGRLLAHRRLPAQRARTTTSTWSRCSSAGTSTPRWSPGSWPATLEAGVRHRAGVRLPAVPRGRRGAGRLLHRRVRARAAAPATSCAPSRASSSTVRST